ncbi:MAG: aldo/keto reductase, partial [Verrucomicrobiota bacterium]
MDLTRTAYGAWNGGRFMNYGEALSDERWIEVVQHAYRRGIRTFMTADVYGSGGADELIGRALKGLPRDSYCLVGAIGHDFYLGKREGSKGFPRFTNPQLRPPNQFAEYLRMATEKSLARCGVDKFDL